MEAEYELVESTRTWPNVFAAIRVKSMEIEHSTREAKKHENRSFNRYRDVSPYDHSRIILNRGEVDYINASLLEVDSAHRRYILTQGPLANTVHHFWLMVWESGSRGIVMLNKLIEKNQIKCHHYWPDNDKRQLVFKSIDLTVTFVGESIKENYICRTFKVTDTKTGDSRDVIQFHYVNWPDFGVPQSPNDFLDLLEDVRKSGCLDTGVGPAVIHCSAGIGRSGTFCLVDSILKMIDDGTSTEYDVELQNILLDMRRFRMSLIQTAEQLRFSYLAILEAIRKKEGRSPLLGKRSLEDAPPPPPHRGRVHTTVINKTEESSEDEEDETSSRDSAVSSELESDDSGPPPLPPRDMPSDSIISLDESPSKSEKQPSSGCDEPPPPYEPPSLARQELNQFEEEILVKEQMLRKEVDGELRLRKKERDDKLADKVKQIKKNIGEAEAAHQRRSLLSKFGWGLVVLVGTGLLVYRIVGYSRS